MTILQTIGLFVVVPALLYGLIGVLSMVPGRAKRRPRYRPGQPWEIEPQWWAGDAPVAPATLEVGAAASAKGGARGHW